MKFHEHGLDAYLPEVPAGHAIVAPLREEFAHERLNALRAVGDDTLARIWHNGFEDNLRIKEACVCEVAPLPLGVDAADNVLHVLLRHRLLPQPDGFESLGAVEVLDEPRNLAAAEVKQARSLGADLPYLQSACLAACAEVEEHEHTLPVELAVLLRLDAPLLPSAQPVTKGLGHPGQPPRATRCGSVGPYVFDLRVRPLGRAEVAALPRLVDRAHEVQVRRRHEPTIPVPRSAGEQSFAMPWMRERAPSRRRLSLVVRCGSARRLACRARLLRESSSSGHATASAASPGRPGRPLHPPVAVLHCGLGTRQRPLGEDAVCDLFSKSDSRVATLRRTRTATANFLGRWRRARGAQARLTTSSLRTVPVASARA